MAVDLGIDIAAVDDLPPSFALASGEANLAYALMRRLDTPAGGLEAIGENADYGFRLRSKLNAPLTRGDQAVIAEAINAECMKDERVQRMRSGVAIVADQTRAGSLALKAQLQGETDDGPFDLIMGVGQLTTEILNDGLPMPEIPALTASSSATAAATPAAPSGGSGGGGAVVAASTLLELCEEPRATSLGSEEWLDQTLEDLGAAGATRSVTVTCMVRALSGATGTFRLRIGGTDGAVDGDIVATVTASSATFTAKKVTGTLTSPGGLQMVKLTGATNTGGSDAQIKDVKVVIL